jgi:hypothetical protein
MWTYLSKPFVGWNRNYALLAAAVFAVGAFFGIQSALYNNFVVDRFGLGANQLGTIEALRETPGFMNVLFIALMIRVAPPLVAAVALVVMGLGIAAYGGVATVTALAIFTVLWSLGFHCWSPLQQAMALKFSPDGDKGKWLGQLNSINSAAWLASIGFCMLTIQVLRYEGLFVVAGVVVALGGAALLFASRQKPVVQEKGLVFKRRYWLYYVLNLLEGCRRQVTSTFAIFALVKIHGMPVETTMILVLINQVGLTFTAPLVGRLVDRFGERLMLSISYAGLIFVFAGYALIHDRPTLYALFCVDNLIFFGGIALTTYLYKIAPEEDLKPSISMGVTMNHAAAVFAPLIGGLAWYYLGYQVIFFGGVALALLSLRVSQWLDPKGLLAREKLSAVEPAA